MMGFLFREKRSDPLSDANHRYWKHLPGIRTASGEAVTEVTALNLLAVFSCVSLLSADFAGLPVHLFRKKKSGSRERVTQHAGAEIVSNKPNVNIDGFTWRGMGEAHRLLWGNHYSEIKRDFYTGEIESVTPLVRHVGDPYLLASRHLGEPAPVLVKMIDGRLVYKWSDASGTRMEFADKLLHVKGFSLDGVTGMSNIAVAREAIGLGLALDRYGAEFFSGGVSSPGLLTVDNLNEDDEDEYMAKLKEQYNGRGLMVLQNGEQYQAIQSMPLEDAQFLGARDYQKKDIAAMYHIPPHKVGVFERNANRASTEQQAREYVDSALLPEVRRWEFALNLQVLNALDRRRSLYYEFDMNGLLRGDSVARAEYYSKRFACGSITPNKIRSLENEDHELGGDVSYVPSNYSKVNADGTTTGNTPISDGTQSDPGPA